MFRETDTSKESDVSQDKKRHKQDEEWEVHRDEKEIYYTSADNDSSRDMETDNREYSNSESNFEEHNSQQEDRYKVRHQTTKRASKKRGYYDFTDRKKYCRH